MHPAIVFAIAGLFAWLNQAPPPPPPKPEVKVEAPKPQPDRVVLLPDADGNAGAVVLRAGAGPEQVVDKAYLGAEITREGAVTVSPQDPADVQARNGALLSARPAAPASYMVYFQSGANALTPESRAVFDELKAELARRPVPEVQVIGHTDRVGRLEANDELSRRRADAVRDILVAAGVPRGQIETSGRGEREPLVPTADEVAEPRNRRVEISVR